MPKMFKSFESWTTASTEEQVAQLDEAIAFRFKKLGISLNDYRDLPNALQELCSKTVRISPAFAMLLLAKEYGERVLCMEKYSADLRDYNDLTNRLCSEIDKLRKVNALLSLECAVLQDAYGYTDGVEVISH